MSHKQIASWRLFGGYLAALLAGSALLSCWLVRMGKVQIAFSFKLDWHHSFAHLIFVPDALSVI